MTDYKWKHIEDLPEGFNPPLQDNEILRKAWRDHQAKLAGSDAVAKFNERLAREWSIETGIIERLYSIDRGTTQVLIERGIDEALIPYGSTDKPAPEIVKILRTHEDVLQGLFDFVKEDRQLTVAYIRELHQAITRDQEFVDGQDQFGNPVKTKLIKGDWKQYPNNPKQTDGSVHEYCPPEHVQSEMEQLVEIHQEHVEKGISPEIQAAWLHHRFTQIHPFQDGNGRVARIIASLILIKAGGLPFTVGRDKRDTYLDALEDADYSQLLPFAIYVTEQQTQGLLKALEITSEVRSAHIGEIIAAGADKLKRRDQIAIESMITNQLISDLKSIGVEYIQSIVPELSKHLHAVNADYFANVANVENMKRRDVNIEKTLKVVDQLGYKASSSAMHDWFGLYIEDFRFNYIDIGLISIDPLERKLIAAVAYMSQEFGQRHRSVIPELIPLASVPFIVSSEYPLESVKESFKEWLTTVFTVGLAEWQKRIR